jgi:hypothetical protein
MTNANNRVGKDELSWAVGRAISLEKARIELLQARQVDEVGGGSAPDSDQTGMPPFPWPTLAGYHDRPRPRPGDLPE